MATKIFTKQESPEPKKVKKKMGIYYTFLEQVRLCLSKAQMQLAIIKKKQCDAKALAIVEHLLEPNVNPQWLLCNLAYINKSHLEDVIEERAITKLCGYVLCNKPLTVVITQQYHISTKKNKVYDVTRRKNFCSSRCYGACNYLLEQMLTSPLWLRDKEEIPIFRFLPAQDELKRSIPGDEIQVGGTDIVSDSNSKTKLDDPNVISQDIHDNKSLNSYIYETFDERESSGVINDQYLHLNSTFEKPSDIDVQFSRSCNEKDVKNVLTVSKHTDSDYKLYTLTNQGVDEIPVPENCEKIQTSNVEDIQESQESVTDLNRVGNDRLKSECNTSIIVEDPEDTHNAKDTVKNKHQRSKKHKLKESIKSGRSSELYTLAMHVEEKVKEWITEDTLCLLSGEENTKSRLLENVMQHDKYLQLCKKLNRLQLEDEKDDRVDESKDLLKPLPHLTALQEEGKKIELKVRAFYTGNMTIQSSESSAKNDKQNNDVDSVLPLTDAHAPNALRRRIFLDKLNRILPDLVQALATRKQVQHIYNSEKSALIKALVNTFSLSAANIIFKTAEWTLVGLIVIKMLSVIDPQLKVLLATQQASMYISMILMSYKLDSNYLDRLIIELTNNPKIFCTSSETNF